MDQGTTFTSSTGKAARAAASLCACSLFLANLAGIGAGGAQAQSSAIMPVQVSVLAPLSISKVEDLDYGYIVVNGAGTIQLVPTATPTCNVSANLVHYGACQPAEFEGVGQTGRIIRFKKPQGDKITLTGPGAPMTITGLTIDGSPQLQAINVTPGYSRYRIVSGDGYWLIRFGGTLNVAAGQAPGVYTATFDIDVAYN